MSGEGQLLVGKLGYEAMAEAHWQADFVGGLTLGADPVAYAIASHATRSGSPLDAFTVRKKAKSHGASQRIEGGLRRGARVVLVDDTVTSGASVLSAARVVTACGAEVLGVLALVDREEGARARLAAAKYDLRTIFTAAELLGSARPPSVEAQRHD